MNVGHGWIVPREDGQKARCGGPLIERDRITKLWADQGMIVRGGWEVMNEMLIPKEAHENQRKLMKQAFYGGAQHLFTSMLRMVNEEHKGVTVTEERRMEMIASELAAWVSHELGLLDPEKGSGNA